MPSRELQFTSRAFTGLLKENDIRISMDEKGCWRERAACQKGHNVFVERLWRSVKYEEVCLKAYETVSDCRVSISNYLGFHNSQRPHSSLDGATTNHIYFADVPLAEAA